MGTARLKSTINTLKVAGASYVLRSTDFNLYDDNGSLSAVGRDAAETIDINFIGVPVSVAGIGENSITITLYKHINSTSLPNDLDLYGGNKNTPADDLFNSRYRLMGTLHHPTAGDFTIVMYLTYYAAVYPPNISTGRIRNALSSLGNSYSSLFGNAQINGLSQTRPDKIAPHRAGELIGYSPTYSRVSIDELPNGGLLPWWDMNRQQRVDVDFSTDGNANITKLVVGSTTITSPPANGSIAVYYSLGTATYTATAYYSDAPAQVLTSKTITLTQEPTKFTLGATSLQFRTFKVDYNNTDSIDLTTSVTVTTELTDSTTNGTRTAETTTQKSWVKGSGLASFAVPMPQDVNLDETITAVFIQVTYAGNVIAAASWNA